MKSYLVKTPEFLKFIFRKWLWNFSRKEKALYLTFDDGPTPEITEWVLDQLHKFNAKATFFCIGENVYQFPSVFQKIIEREHSIGNHTNNHLNGFKTANSTYIHNIEDAQKCMTENSKLVANSLGEINVQNSKLFRPPYGKLRLFQSIKIRNKGYKIVLWDVLSADFDTSISNNYCLENIIKNTSNGSILVFHDTLKASEHLKYVLPKILEYYSDMGYTFNKIT